MVERIQVLLEVADKEFDKVCLAKLIVAATSLLTLHLHCSGSLPLYRQYNLSSIYQKVRAVSGH